MRFRSEVIFSTYSEAVRVSSSGKIFDIKNNEISIDEEEIQAKIAELQAAEPLRLLRIERNRLLQETDWWAGQDLAMTQDQKDYRQALRDLPSTASPSLDENGQLTNVTWPTKPE